MTMRRFIKAIWRLRFKTRNRTAQEANACHPSHIVACPYEKFANKPEQRSPKTGWRLLAHISYTSPTARIDETHDIEIDEDTLGRIDFLACLFGSRKIE